MRRDPSQFAGIAAARSLDEGSKANGGELAPAGRGAYVAEFEAALFGAKEGDYGVVQTQFGYHVFNLLERRTTTLAQATPQLRRQALAEPREQAIAELLRDTAEQETVRVNPRFGEWDPETVSVVEAALEGPGVVSSPAPGGAEAPAAGDPLAPGGEVPQGEVPQGEVRRRAAGPPGRGPAAGPAAGSGHADAVIPAAGSAAVGTSATALVVVVTSPRTAPGLLSWPAWEALRSAPVGVASADHPQVPFLRDAGVEVRPQARPDAPADLATGYGGEATPGDVALARLLHDRAVAGEQVVWLADAGADAGLVRALGDLAARERRVPLEVVYGSYDLPGSHLLDVVGLMDRLRSPGGCPWDAEQTHASLRKHLLEEAYEAYEALEDGDTDALREELGDVLLQVVFHARIAQETSWTVDDVADGLVDKLVRRHPHVFAGASADDLEGSWDRLKAAEGRTSVSGVPLGQPALALAAALQKRATRAGQELPPVGDGLGAELWELVRSVPARPASTRRRSCGPWRAASGTTCSRRRPTSLPD